MNELEAGKDTDARIAAEVMQWIHVSNDDAREDGAIVYMVFHDEKVIKGTPYKIEDNLEPDLYDYSFTEWSPSTDISAAWEVAERLREQGLTMKLSLNSDKYHFGIGATHGRVFCEFIPFKLIYEPLGTAMGETAPLAICRAALKAVEQPSVVAEKQDDLSNTKE